MLPKSTFLTRRLAALCALALTPVALLAANPKPLQEQGTIKSIDTSTHTLVLTDSKDQKEHKFQWNTQSKFTDSGKIVAPTELKPGEHIRLTYRAGGDMPTIERGHLATAKPEKSAPAKS